jgi:putative Holliday junction resolvase
MRVLGIDYGDKKIGTAFGDLETKVAVPLDVLTNHGDETLTAILKLIEDEGVERVVVGVPLSTGNHHDSGQLDKTRAFITELQDATDVEVIEEDESYTTAESIRLQVEEGAQAAEDALAAMLILQAYMNKQ